MDAPTVVDRKFSFRIRRREERGVDRIEGGIIHAMGERIVVGDQILPAWDFLNRSFELTGVPLSVHALIEPDGTIVRCADDWAKCNHAGESEFGALTNLNWTFLGAEFLLPGQWVYGDFKRAMDTGTPHYTEAQYDAAGWLYATWMREHDFARSRIVGHQQVSGDNVRGEGNGKVDPGVGFNHGKLTIRIDRWLEEFARVTP